MWMVSVEELRGSMEMVASRAKLEELEDEVEGEIGEALLRVGDGTLRENGGRELMLRGASVSWVMLGWKSWPSE